MLIKLARIPLTTEEEEERGAIDQNSGAPSEIRRYIALIRIAMFQLVASIPTTITFVMFVFGSFLFCDGTTRLQAYT
jgi:hypothetical protein